MKYVFLFVSFVLLSFPAAANACSCNFSSPCSAFADTKAVFVGKMLGGTEKHEFQNSKGETVTIESGTVSFSVKEVFKGQVSGEIKIEIDSMKGTSCGTYGLKRGADYVVYAYGSSKNPEILYTGVCTRTQEVSGKEAQEDLAFLRNLAPVGSGGNLSGRVRADNTRGVGTIPMANVKVKITGEDGKVLTVTTGKEGDFEIKRLKAGKYRIEPQLPANYKTEEKFEEIQIADRGCSFAYFEAEMNGQISGRIIDADGKPYDSIFLQLNFADDVEGESIYGHSEGKNGEFLVEGIPPGEYVLYVELQHDDYNKNKNYYYPGTFNPAEAKKIKVGLGEQITGLSFPLPSEYRVRTIKGQVVWADGKPAAGVEVLLLCPQNAKTDGYTIEFTPPGVRTDEQGNFELQAFTGEAYWLEARFEQLGKYFADTKYFTSPGSKIVVRDNLDNLKLVLAEGETRGCGEK